MNDQQHTTSKRLRCLVAGVVLAVLLAGTALAITLIHAAACGSDDLNAGETSGGPVEPTALQAPVESAPTDTVEILLEKEDNVLVYGIRDVPGTRGTVDCQIMVILYMGRGERATQSVMITAEGGSGFGGVETRRSIRFDELSRRPIAAMVRLYAKDSDDPGREYHLVEEKYIDLRKPYQAP